MAKRPTQQPLFPDGDDLPLFSGTAPTVESPAPYAPTEPELEQAPFPVACRACRDTGWLFVRARRLTEVSGHRRCLCAAGQSTARAAAAAAYRASSTAELAPDPRPQITGSEAAARLMAPRLVDLDREEMWVLLLDVKNRLLGDPLQIYRGLRAEIRVAVCEVFRAAVSVGASAIVVLHNHPGGDPTPSAEDVRLTADMHAAGTILDVELLDHVVVARRGHASLRARGAIR